MGEENEEKKEKKGGDKKEQGPITVVIKVDMHCEGCARKVKKCVRDIPGVQEIKAEIESNKLTVVGKVDPKGVCDRLQKKTQKKVELISPAPKKEDNNEKKKQGDANKDNNEKEKKPKEAPVVTTVLKVFLHCDGCAQTVQKAIMKMKGVLSAEPDSKTHTVTVKGTMDPKKLVDYLHKKTRKHVEIVPPKKDGGGKKDNEKKDGSEGKKGDEKKDGSEGKKGDNTNTNTNTNTNNNNNNNKNNNNNNNKSEDQSKSNEAGEGKKNEAPFPKYVIEYVPPPQIFSDENPNACSLM